MSAIPAGYKLTEVGVIPQEWDVPKIESILSEISMGPFGSDIKVSNFVSEGVPVLSGANVRSERLEDSFTNFVTPAKAKSLKKAVARRGDIVVTHRGTLGQISYIPDDSAFDSYVISQSQFRARFNANLVTPTWVALYFLSAQGATKLLEGKGHTGVPALAQATTKFRLLHIPLPPLPEQRAIAAALSDVDALLAKLDQFIAKKRDLKQAAMQQLLTGQTRLPGFSGAWEVKLLPDVCRFRGGKAHEQHISDTGKYVCVNSKFISTDGKVRKYSSANFCSAKRNDVLMVMSDLPNGRALAKAYLVEQDDLYAVNQRVCVLTAYRDCPEYLFYVLNRNPYFLRFDDGVSQTHLLNHVFQKCELQMPPTIDEQTAIATVLSDMDAELAALEARRDKTRALKQGMMQELLTGRIRLV